MQKAGTVLATVTSLFLLSHVVCGQRYSRGYMSRHWNSMVKATLNTMDSCASVLPQRNLWEYRRVGRIKSTSRFRSLTKDLTRCFKRIWNSDFNKDNVRYRKLFSAAREMTRYCTKDTWPDRYVPKWKHRMRKWKHRMRKWKHGRVGKGKHRNKAMQKDHRMRKWKHRHMPTRPWWTGGKHNMKKKFHNLVHKLNSDCIPGFLSFHDHKLMNQ